MPNAPETPLQKIDPDLESTAETDSYMIDRLIRRRQYLKWIALTATTAFLTVVAKNFLDSRDKVQDITKTEEPKEESPLPQTFEFEVITINKSAEKINTTIGEVQYLTEDLGNGVTLEMVAIPEGIFTMGSPKQEKYSKYQERPQHAVTVQPFFMGKFQVTQAQWRTVASLDKIERQLNPNPSKFKGDNRPVEKVSWDDAREFCQRLSQKTGKKYRLPSEAQWEYAARAGTTTPFHFGETLTTDLANYNGRYRYQSEPRGKFRRQTTPVGSFYPNAFGLYGMHGNVWEWCVDHWHNNYQGAPTDASPWLSNPQNQLRVIRGGSWHSDPLSCRSSYRDKAMPNLRYETLGLRVVLVT